MKMVCECGCTERSINPRPAPCMACGSPTTQWVTYWWRGKTSEPQPFPLCANCYEREVGWERCAWVVGEWEWHVFHPAQDKEVE